MTMTDVLKINSDILRFRALGSEYVADMLTDVLDKSLDENDDKLTWH